MTHIAPMADSQGEFGEYKHAVEIKCRECKAERHVRYRIWESSCGGYEDYNYKCFACGHSWWVDGIDS